MLKFTIYTTPRTKKNSSQMIPRKNGSWFPMPSKAYKEFEAACAEFMPKLKEPISYPVNVKMLFYMPTRRRVDLGNLQAALLDILTHYGVIEDDNSDIVVSMDGSKVFKKQPIPRAEVEITKLEGGDA